MNIIKTLNLILEIIKSSISCTKKKKGLLGYNQIAKLIKSLNFYLSSIHDEQGINVSQITVYDL